MDYCQEFVHLQVHLFNSALRVQFEICNFKSEKEGVKTKEMKPSIRIRKKILKYSVIFKALGIIEKEEYNQMKDYYS